MKAICRECGAEFKTFPSYIKRRPGGGFCGNACRLAADRRTKAPRPPLKFPRHGGHGTSEYKTWAAMVQRCENPRCGSFCNYGARGISVCARWRRSFAAFLEDMGHRPSPQHSIDRINNNGNYEPGNCRWATWTEQARNRRERRRRAESNRAEAVA